MTYCSYYLRAVTIQGWYLLYSASIGKIFSKTLRKAGYEGMIVMFPQGVEAKVQ